MYFLLQIRLNYGDSVRCSVTHVRPGPDGLDAAELVEEHAVPDPEDPHDRRERGWIVPANPRPGDRLVFEMDEVCPVGRDGADYTWEAAICGANGPYTGEGDPCVFRVHVPAQVAEDIGECPDVELIPGYAVKDGPRRFVWTIGQEMRLAA